MRVIDNLSQLLRISELFTSTAFLKGDDKKSIGYFEADTVAHCGDSLSGNFAWSLTMTDLKSGWTENRATLSKKSEEIKKAVSDITRGSC